jgi:hypothetical protein
MTDIAARFRSCERSEHIPKGTASVASTSPGGEQRR